MEQKSHEMLKTIQVASIPSLVQFAPVIFLKKLKCEKCKMMTIPQLTFSL